MLLSAANSERIDHAKFKGSDFDNDRRPEIAIWPLKPEVLISGKYDIIIIDIIKISMVYPGLSITARSKNVFPGDCTNDRQTEIFAI